MSPRPIEAVFVAARDGDPGSQRELVGLLQGPLLAAARRLVGDVATAEDVFIQAMTRLFAGMHAVEEPAAIRSYARRIVCSIGLDVLRSRSERDSRRALKDTRALGGQDPARVVGELDGGDTGADIRIIREEVREEVRDEVERIGEPGRTLLRMHYEQGLTFDQISEVSGLSRRTVLRRVGEARVVLAARLRGLEEYVR